MIINFFKRLFSKNTKIMEADKNSFGRLSIESEKLIYVHSGKQEEMRWDDLIEAGIVTTDEGPFFEDVFFLLIGPTQEHKIIIPHETTGTNLLLERLQKLPGYDDQAVIDAMCCTSNKWFTCWKK